MNTNEVYGWSSDLGRTCKKLRQVIETDDAGVNHRMMKYCGNLLAPSQMYCERCEAESSMQMEFQL